MGKIFHFRNLHEENSSVIPVHWIYKSINPVFKLFLTNQIVLSNYVPVKFEIFSNNYTSTSL